MTLVVKSTKSDTIFLPEKLMESLNLQEGETIKAIIEGQTLRLARLEAFLNLRGSLADDDEFDEAVESLQNSWNSWTYPTSA
jgi:antitoxin component of MazEF toxin-antitoxin module